MCPDKRRYRNPPGNRHTPRQWTTWRYRSSTEWVHALATLRDDAWRGLNKNIALEIASREISLRPVRRWSGETDDAAAKEVLGVVCHCPMVSAACVHLPCNL